MTHWYRPSIQLPIYRPIFSCDNRAKYLECRLYRPNDYIIAVSGPVRTADRVCYRSTQLQVSRFFEDRFIINQVLLTTRRSAAQYKSIVFGLYSTTFPIASVWRTLKPAELAWYLLSGCLQCVVVLKPVNTWLVLYKLRICLPKESMYRQPIGVA